MFDLARVGPSSAIDLPIWPDGEANTTGLPMYTDVHRTAAVWMKQEFKRGPPANLPGLAAIPGWHIEAYHTDILHNVWLGHAKDAAGAWLLDAVALCPDETLETIFEKFTIWCLEKRLHCGMVEFSIGCDSLLDYPMSHTNGYRTKLVCAFLGEHLRQLATTTPALAKQAALRCKLKLHLRCHPVFVGALHFSNTQPDSLSERTQTD